MDITPIYDLRARLRASMIAGTNLLSEDFRLKRAVEAVAPLEAASPVFAKIGQLSRALLDPACENKEGALLDAITLTDAVLCTQGAISVDTISGQGTENEIEKLQGNTWGSVVTNAPYSVVKALQEALTSSGSGHFSYVTETHEAHPELFADYRVKVAMVQALGASYAELADKVESWLKEESASILPLLQSKFDPHGKKEMIRRIRVMETIAPKEANSFFIERLADTEKELRQAVIFALRHCPENEELLWELAISEKGNCKKAVYQALVHMESQKAEQFFLEFYQKNPKEAMQHLRFSNNSWAARIVAAKLEEQVQPFMDKKDYFMTDEQVSVLQETLLAVIGKTGTEIINALKKMILLEKRLSNPFEERKKKWEFSSFFLYNTLAVQNGYGTLYNQKNSKTISLKEMLVHIIQRTLVRTADTQMAEFVIELFDERQKDKEERETYFAVAALSHLFVDEDSSNWLAEQLLDYRHSSKLYEPLALAWVNVSWSETMQSFIIEDTAVNSDVLDGYRIYFVHRLKQDMSGKIADIVMKCGNQKLDTLLAKYVSKENEAYRLKLENYYYKRALVVGDNRSYLRVLKNIGCKKCDGLAVSYFKHNSGNNIAIWTIKNFESYYLPGDSNAKYQEMQKVYELVLNKKIKLYNHETAKEEFAAYLEELKPYSV